LDFFAVFLTADFAFFAFFAFLAIGYPQKVVVHKDGHNALIGQADHPAIERFDSRFARNVKRRIAHTCDGRAPLEGDYRLAFSASKWSTRVQPTTSPALTLKSPRR
jgi:hypothetical protein